MYRPGGGKLPKSLVLTRRKETRRGRERGRSRKETRERWRKVYLLPYVMCSPGVSENREELATDMKKKEEAKEEA